jgi:hypothetical protein
MPQSRPRDAAELAKLTIDAAAGEAGGPREVLRALCARLRGRWRNADAVPHPVAPPAGQTLDREIRSRIIELLCDGHSLSEAARVSGASAEAVGGVMIAAGQAAAWYQERVLRHLACRRIRLDAIATFANDDVWTFVAIDSLTKLVPCWRVGGRRSDTALALVNELAPRLDHSVKLVRDRDNAYLDAVEGAPECPVDVDILILRELFGDHWQPECRSEAVAEKIEQHTCAVSLFAMHHNFVRVHATPRTAPAAAAGVIKAPWKVSNIVDVLQMWEQLKTGPWYERLVVLKG